LAVAVTTQRSTPSILLLSGAVRMHHLGHGMHMLDRRLRLDAMAEVEDMARAVAGPP
jgi:hypothetical protein